MIKIYANDLKNFARERERERERERDSVRMRNDLTRANAVSERKKSFGKFDFFSFAV